MGAFIKHNKRCLDNKITTMHFIFAKTRRQGQKTNVMYSDFFGK